MSGCLRSVKWLVGGVRESELGHELTREGSFICDVERQEDTHGTSVVCSSDSPEPFLTRGIPLSQPKGRIVSKLY
jgi:hypothetical protein